MAVLLEGQKYAPIPIAGFIQQLANNGLVIVSGQYDHIFAVLGRYFPKGIKVNYINNDINADPASVELFQQVLCPLLVKSQQEQEIFLRVSRNFFEERLFELDNFPEKPNNGNNSRSPEKPNLKIPTWLWIASYIVGFAFLYYCYCTFNIRPIRPEPTTKITVPPAPKNEYIPQPEPLIMANDRPAFTINYPLAVLLSLSGGIFYIFILIILASKTKSTIIKKNKKPPYFFFIPEKDHLIRNFGTMYIWTKNLVQRKESLQNRLDIKRSIEVSIKNGGYSTVVLKPILQRPKYLFFIDFDFYDQQAYVFRFVTNFLFGEGVDLELFYFRLDPRKCWNTNHPLGITLADLKISFPTHKLVLFTDGSNLVNLKSGLVHTWVQDAFLSWEQKVLLTPKAEDRWGIIENALAETFKLLPADIDGFTAMSEYLNFPEKEVLMPALKHLRKNPKQIINAPITSLTAETVTMPIIRAFFAEAKIERDSEQLLLQWAYATALYAVPSWDITLLIGNTIQEITGSTKLVNLQNLLLITSLPWLKINYIPVSLRKSLLANLDSVHRTEVIRVIIDTLERKDPHEAAEDSVAALEKKIKVLELTSLLPTKKNAATGKKELLAYHRGGMVKDPLVKELIIKKLRKRRFQHIFLVAGLIFLTFFAFTKLLTKTIPDLAVLHNNLAVEIANGRNLPFNTTNYNRVLNELQQSLEIRELFQAFYNVKSLKYNFAINYFNPVLPNRFDNNYFKGENIVAMDSILHPLRMFFGEDYVPDDAIMTHYLKQVWQNSPDKAYSFCANLQFTGKLRNSYTKEKVNPESFKISFINARRQYNPMKTILPLSGKIIVADNSIINQTQVDSLIRLDALFIILYKGGPINQPVETKPEKKTFTKTNTKSNIKDKRDTIISDSSYTLGKFLQTGQNPKDSLQEQIQKTSTKKDTLNIDTLKIQKSKDRWVPIVPMPARPKKKLNQAKVIPPSPTQDDPEKNSLSKSSTYRADTLMLLYQPLIFLLAQSKVYYNQYTKNDYIYGYAKQIDMIDRKMLALLTNNSNLVSGKMKPAVQILVNHLTAWTTAFSEMSGEKAISDSTYFRVIYKGPTFKDVPSDDLHSEYTRLQPAQ